MKDNTSAKTQIVVEKQEWKDFLYIIKVKTGQQGGSGQLRKYVRSYNKRNNKILVNRK